VLTYHHQPQPYRNASDLAFLDNESALLLMDGREAASIEIQVFSLALRQVTRRYLFPFLPTRMMKARFITHPPYSRRSSANQNTFFSPDPQVDILPIEFKIVAPQRSPEGDPFLVVLSLSKFQELHAQITGNRPVNWENWGPKMTRWFPTGILKTVGPRSCYGSRLIGMFQPHVFHQQERSKEWDWGPSGNLVLLDFNPRAISRGSQSYADDDKCNVVVHDKVSTWTHPITSQEVESSLPFRVFFHRQNPLGASGKMYIEGTSVIRYEVCRFSFIQVQ
jgi:hypothetical protein